MAVNNSYNSDIEINFQNTGGFIGRFVKSIRPIIDFIYIIDFISLSNKSFKSLTCVGKVQYYSILFQRFDIYFCFPTINGHPSSMNQLETVRCDILFHVRSYL